MATVFENWKLKREIKRLARQLNYCEVHLEPLYIAHIGHGWEPDQWSCKRCEQQEKDAINRLRELRERRLVELKSDYSIGGLLK